MPDAIPETHRFRMHGCVRPAHLPRLQRLPPRQRWRDAHELRHRRVRFQLAFCSATASGCRTGRSRLRTSNIIGLPLRKSVLSQAGRPQSLESADNNLRDRGVRVHPHSSVATACRSAQGEVFCTCALLSFSSLTGTVGGKDSALALHQAPNLPEGSLVGMQTCLKGPTSSVYAKLGGASDA